MTAERETRLPGTGMRPGCSIGVFYRSREWAGYRPDAVIYAATREARAQREDPKER